MTDDVKNERGALAELESSVARLLHIANVAAGAGLCVPEAVNPDELLHDWIAAADPNGLVHWDDAAVVLNLTPRLMRPVHEMEARLAEAEAREGELIERLESEAWNCPLCKGDRKANELSRTFFMQEEPDCSRCRKTHDLLDRVKPDRRHGLHCACAVCRPDGEIARAALAPVSPDTDGEA